MAEKKTTSKKRNALGRGLSALLEDNDNLLPKSKTPIKDPVEAVANFHEIPLEDIEVNPFQPRTHFDEEALNELAESIKVQGIIQPITVRAMGGGKFQLISGERRFQASKRAGLEKVPAYIRLADDQQMMEMAIIENVQREDLNAMEVALGYQRLIEECDLRQEDLSERVGKNRTTVTNYLRLLKLPPDIQAAVRDKKISMGHARALITIEDPAVQLYIFKKVVDEELSVRKTEALVRNFDKPNEEEQQDKKKSSGGLSPEYQRLQNSLSSHFGTKINIKNEGNKGEIRIPYVSVEDLNRILEILEFHQS